MNQLEKNLERLLSDQMLAGRTARAVKRRETQKQLFVSGITFAALLITVIGVFTLNFQKQSGTGHYEMVRDSFSAYPVDFAVSEYMDVRWSAPFTGGENFSLEHMTGFGE